MNRKVFNLLLPPAILLVGLWVWYITLPSTPSTITPPRPSPKVSAARAQVVLRPSTFNALPVPPPAPPGADPALPPYARKPEGNLIEFRVVDGFAVAYGDVILGRPEAGFQPDRGITEAPRAQLWELPEVPYTISPSLPNPQRVEKALDYFRQHTPVRFVPYEGRGDAIVFEVGSEHCFSALGKTGGLQSIRLATECQPQEIMHEVMHALGFIHEQSRPDRDQYLEILWPAIQEKYQAQFAIVPDSLAEPERDTPFDYHSIMLYSSTAFAATPGTPTMRAVGSAIIAPVQFGMSDLDLQRINRLYNVYEPGN